MTRSNIMSEDSSLETATPSNPLKFFQKLFNHVKRGDDEVDAMLDSLIDKPSNGNGLVPQYPNEKKLIANIIELRDLTSVDVMIPRAEVVAIEIDDDLEDIQDIISKTQFSRYPVYRETLDNVIGSIHIKDLLIAMMESKKIVLESLCKPLTIVSPGMPVHDLLIQMQETRKHMVLVVDEYGGIDGMITLGDIIEDIVGNIDDEYNQNEMMQPIRNADGSVTVDAKMIVEDFEEQFGQFLTDEEREDHNTLAGVVFTLVGRVPARGEVITHPTGTEFEIIDADLRRINRLKLRNIPINNPKVNENSNA
jgi:CBS domain containing-hemolysin-like protein